MSKGLSTINVLRLSLAQFELNTLIEESQRKLKEREQILVGATSYRAD